jgi:hypothetical protein
MYRYNFSLLILSFTLFVAGCSKQNSVGDKMITQSENTRVLGEKWNDGKQQVLEGQELIAEGNMLKKQGALKISEGTDKYNKGQMLVKSSEDNYKAIFPSSDLIGDLKKKQ